MSSPSLSSSFLSLFGRFLDHNNPLLRRAEHAWVALTLAAAALYLVRNGGVAAKRLLGSAASLPPLRKAIDHQLDAQVEEIVRDMFPRRRRSTQGAEEEHNFLERVPERGMDREELVALMEALADEDRALGEEGKAFAYVYTPLEAGHKLLVERAFTLFMHQNGLNPVVFQNLRRFEVEVVAMCRWMMGGVEGVCGNMTSGGTESIICAMKAARDFAAANRRTKGQAEVVLPSTAHPAFEKAGQLLGMKMKWVAVLPDTREADVQAMSAAITPNTIALVGSAPSYPHGVMDPIPALAELALSRGLLLHVDSCIGGFVLPWFRFLSPEERQRCGLPEREEDLPRFDFRVEGVTSLSMDVHKYGFAAKGASVVLYRDTGLRKYQYSAYSEWPGGLFVSPSLLGTRAGGSIAAAWAALMGLGVEGFKETVKQLMDTTRFLREGIQERLSEDLQVVGQPAMSILAIEACSSSRVDVLAVADELEEASKAEGAAGWHIERNQLPPSIHMTIMPSHARLKEKFLEDLERAVERVKAHPERYVGQGSVAMYGGLALARDTLGPGLVNDFLVKWASRVYSTK
ncbi:Sphingosine-1-phosphate lyase [Balamuthia mandrillaris]